MNLSDALTALVTPAHLPGRSDAGVVTKVNAKLAGKTVHGPAPVALKTLAPAAGVDGGLTVTPLDALFRLARMTGFGVASQIFSWYEHWGWLRYLGAFELPTSGALTLSSAAMDVRANQRRVMSEDLGVGFAGVVAQQWVHTLQPGHLTRIVDVDAALAQSPHAALPAGYSIWVRDRQPDYLLVTEHLLRRTVTIRTLEAKGTINPSTALDQLGHAVTQLASLTVNGVSPPGIAVSTVSKGPGIRYLAVDPDDGAVEAEVTADDFERVRGSWFAGAPAAARRDDGVVEVADAATLGAASLMTSMGALASWAGDTVSARAFLPAALVREGRGREGTRVGRQLAGTSYHGLAQRFPGPDGAEMEIFTGLAEPVADALASGDAEVVRERQAETARLASWAEPRTVRDDELAGHTVDDEGAVLAVRVLS